MTLLASTELRYDVSALDLTTFYHVYQNFHLGSGNNYTLYVGQRSGSYTIYSNDPCKYNKLTILIHIS